LQTNCKCIWNNALPSLSSAPKSTQGENRWWIWELFHHKNTSCINIWTSYSKLQWKFIYIYIYIIGLFFPSLLFLGPLECMLPHFIGYTKLLLPVLIITQICLTNPPFMIVKQLSIFHRHQGRYVNVRHIGTHRPTY